MLEASEPILIGSPTERSIDELPFQGFGEATPDHIRQLLRRCDVKVGGDIETLGCTGAMKHGLALDDVFHLRLGIAGGGIGLPCFVPSSRFCKAHNTIGGLQEGQKPYYEEAVPMVSRELTAKERGTVAYTEAVRHNAKSNVGEQMTAAQLALSGHGELPFGTELIEEDESVPQAPLEVETTRVVPLEVAYWKCPEHRQMNWSCRFCLAQAIVDGELVPEFVVHQPEHDTIASLGQAVFGLSGPELVDTIEQLNHAGVDKVEVYVLAKTLTRRLG